MRGVLGHAAGNNVRETIMMQDAAKRRQESQKRIEKATQGEKGQERIFRTHTFATNEIHREERERRKGIAGNQDARNMKSSPRKLGTVGLLCEQWADKNRQEGKISQK